MTQKVKPDFNDYGISLGKIGDNCGDILLSQHSGHFCYVGDRNTLVAAEALIPHGVQRMEFHDSPACDEVTAAAIRAETREADVLIAVGSGTINDLCKYAAYLDGKAYSVIATAPSMNGYVSANASITVNGFKKTLAAAAPVAVICDVPTLAAAPKELIAAGIGDTLCRSTIQADWLLSHLLLDTPYEPAYFEWLRESEARLLNDPGDVEALIEAILISGLAMRDFGSSAPASQGEHMLAHTMEMLFPTLPHAFHGLTIAVTALEHARRQQRLLEAERAQIAFPPRFDALPAHLRPEAEQQYRKKLPHAGAVEALNSKLQEYWPQMAERLATQFLPPSALEVALKAAGCPTHPQEIQWPPEKFAEACQLAHLTRDRFTFLDLQ